MQICKLPPPHAGKEALIGFCLSKNLDSPLIVFKLFFIFYPFFYKGLLPADTQSLPNHNFGCKSL